MSTVAILGAGSVGQALAERLDGAGAKVRFGVRDAASTRSGLHDALSHLDVLDAPSATRDADIVLLAVPAGAAVDATRSADIPSGRVLVDCTNPLRWDGGPVWTPPPPGSVAQQLAATFPELRVVKGFNHFGAEIQRSPALAGGPADALFAGDDDAAKAGLIELADRMGFHGRDAGPLRNAALLENLAVLWIQLATAGGLGREFAFRVDRRV